MTILLNLIITTLLNLMITLQPSHHEATLGQRSLEPTHTQDSEGKGMDRTWYVLGQRPKESLNGEPLGAGLQTIYTGIHGGYTRLSVRLCTVHTYMYDITVELRLCQ